MRLWALLQGGDVKWWLREQEEHHLSPVFFTCAVPIEGTSCLHDLPADIMPSGTGQAVQGRVALAHPLPCRPV